MKYTIMHVNDRANDNMEHNKLILKDFDYIDDIEFFNGNVGNAFDVLDRMGIRLNVWSPYDGRSFAPLPGEYGVWVSTIRTWQYIVENKIDSMLVLEDDILLEESFVNNLSSCVGQLPEDYDFISLYYFEGQNDVDNSTDFGAKNIHRSLNQYSAGQATLYSYYGAKKLLKLVSRHGIEYTTDCFIFNKSQKGLISGYSIKPNDLSFLKHDYKNIKSLIDTENIRNVEM